MVPHLEPLHARSAHSPVWCRIYPAPALCSAERVASCETSGSRSDCSPRPGFRKVECGPLIIGQMPHGVNLLTIRRRLFVASSWFAVICHGPARSEPRKLVELDQSSSRLVQFWLPTDQTW